METLRLQSNKKFVFMALACHVLRFFGSVCICVWSLGNISLNHVLPTVRHTHVFSLSMHNVERIHMTNIEKLTMKCL